MKTLFTLLVLLPFGIPFSAIAGQNGRAELIDFEFGVSAGFRLDQFDWNIGGYNQFSQSVNVLSELDWKDLEIWQVGLNGKLTIGKDKSAFRPYMRGSLSYGWINAGSVRDSDYNGNNRTMEYSRSLSDTEDDDVSDFAIGVGLEKTFWQKRFTLGLVGGYSHHELNLRANKGVQVISNSLPVNQPIPGLNSTYQAKWVGPFAGIDFRISPMERFCLTGTVEYHWLDYDAEADWNKIEAYAHPVSFKHEAETADGLLATLKGSYLINSNWTIDLTFVYRDFSAKDGNDWTFWKTGDTSRQRFNEANWESFGTTIGFTYSFN